MGDDNKYKYLFKVVLIGDASVGKTCLIRRYAKGQFIGNPGATIGVDFIMRNVDINDEVIKVCIIAENAIHLSYFMINLQRRLQHIRDLYGNLLLFIVRHSL